MTRGPLAAECSNPFGAALDTPLIQSSDGSTSGKERSNARRGLREGGCASWELFSSTGGRYCRAAFAAPSSFQVVAQGSHLSFPVIASMWPPALGDYLDG